MGKDLEDETLLLSSFLAKASTSSIQPGSAKPAAFQVPWNSHFPNIVNMSFSGLPTSCPGFCEGSCAALKIDPSFYSASDPNRIRRNATINFVTDVNVDKMRDVKKVRFLSKREDDPDSVGYGAPLIRAERPWVIFIDHRTEDEKKMDEIKQKMGESVMIKQEQNVQDVEFQIPTIESYGSTELVDDKDAVGKYIKNIKMEDKKYLEGLADVGSSSNKRKDFEGGVERPNVKRRKASSPTDGDSSDGATQMHRNEKPTKVGRHNNGRVRQRSISPIKMQELRLSEKGKGLLSKERSYLKDVERPGRRISTDSKSEDEDHNDDLGDQDTDYQAEEEEEEEEEEEDRLPVKQDRRKQHQTRHRIDTKSSRKEKLKQPSRGPTTQELKRRKNVEALKKLQKQDLEENRTGGTYVQCCNKMCQKWRLVAEYLESSQVGPIIPITFYLVHLGA